MLMLTLVLACLILGVWGGVVVLLVRGSKKACWCGGIGTRVHDAHEHCEMFFGKALMSKKSTN